MNNEVEYEALVTRFCLVRGVYATSLRIKYDSQLVVNQVKGEYVVKGEKMKYLSETKVLLNKINEFEIQVIPREEN